MRRPLLLLFIVLIAGCGVFGMSWYRTADRLQRLQSEVSRPWDAPYERAALEATARRERVTVEYLKRLVLPITIGLPDRRCVELRPKTGVAGGTDVYCFSNGSKRLIAQFQIGE